LTLDAPTSCSGQSWVAAATGTAGPSMVPMTAIQETTDNIAPKIALIFFNVFLLVTMVKNKSVFTLVYQVCPQ
jgi:hypothetical protein